MAPSAALRRLLRIRELEEEQGRVALEAAIGELNRLKNAQAATVERGSRGRQLVGSSAVSGEFADRLAGLEETRAAERLAAVLAARIAAADEEAANLRDDYLASRVERRQAETLIDEAEARDRLDTGRKTQQALDDWFLNRRRRAVQVAQLPRAGRKGESDERPET